MNIQEVKKDQCVGCNACRAVCPQQSITMQPDQEGFFYPIIDKTSCVDCSLCVNVCPSFSTPDLNNKLTSPAVLAVWSTDALIRAKSSSGGVFSTLAEKVIKQNGIVFGAAFDSNLQLKHIAVHPGADLQPLRGSKYVQSDMEGVYEKAKEHLEKGDLVLFSGTPCQIAGLYSFLGKDHNNLLTCDLVCHGVPSPQVFQRYVNFLEKKFNAKALKFEFRNKQKGWKTYGVAVQFDNGKEYFATLNEDNFMIGFLKNLYLRPSCYQCQFTGIPRIADITLGDFWGISRQCRDLDNDKGISLVLLNTRKGQKVFQKLQGNIFCTESTLEQAISGNHCLVKPIALSPMRAGFFADFFQLSFETVLMKHMSPPSLFKRIRQRMVRILRAIPKRVKRLISTK